MFLFLLTLYRPSRIIINKHVCPHKILNSKPNYNVVISLQQSFTVLSISDFSSIPCKHMVKYAIIVNPVDDLDGSKAKTEKLMRAICVGRNQICDM